MKKTHLLILALVFMSLFFGSALRAGDKVRIVLHAPPPGMLNVDNFWSFTLINLTGESQQLYLKGSATEEKDGLIATGQTVSITLKPNETKNMKVSDLPQTPDINYVAKVGRYKESLIRQGRFPDGNYEICVKVIQTGTNEEIGSDCFTQSVQAQGTLTLITPSDGEELDAEGQVIFSWLNTGKAGDKFEIKIVEVEKGQNPGSAMEKNIPLFTKKDIKSSPLIYPPTAKRFDKGKKYAWQVTGGSISSEIFTFTISSGTRSIIDMVFNPVPCECCFDMVVESDNSYWDAVKITTNPMYNTISSITPSTGVTVLSQTTSEVILQRNYFTSGSNAGKICFNYAPNPFPVTISWSTNGGVVFAPPSQMDLQCSPPCSTETGGCIDFENGTNTNNWNSDNVAEIQILSDSSDTHNNTNVLKLTDGSGGSIAWNNAEFGGNWLQMGQEGCLCFDYKVDWNENVYTAPITFPKVSIYTGLPINNVNDFVNNRIRATFVGHSTNPPIEDNVWNNWCLAIGSCTGSNLPSNTFGEWVIYENGVLLSGTAACDAWNTLIQNVTGIVLATDYNDQPSEKVYFDNFCWTCTETGSTDPCDAYSASIRKDTLNSGCCGWITLNHPSVTTGVNKVQLVPAPSSTSNTFISPMTIPAGWSQQTNTPTNYVIRVNPTQTVPTGVLNDLIYVCMNTSTSPQGIAVNWLGVDNSIICTDTVYLNCDLPCVEFTSNDIQCAGDSMKVNFTFTNNSGFDMSNIALGTGSNATITPSNIVLSPVVSNNSSSTNMEVTLSNVTEGEEVCIYMTFTSPDGCCVCTDTLCVVIPGCVCEKIDASITGSTLDCCYDLSLQNDYLAGYFTNVKLTGLNGVTFAYFNTDNDWNSSTYIPTNEINLEHWAGDFHIPLGTAANVVTFCLSGYTTSTQEILVEWMVNDSVACSDTLKTYCPPPPPKKYCGQLVNDTIVCLENGNYEYRFNVKNESSFFAEGFALSIISPYTALHEFNYAPIPNAPNPGHVSQQYTIPLSGNPGDQVCYVLSLFRKDTTYDDNGKIRIATGECCHADTVCISLPDCGQPCGIQVTGGPQAGDTLCAGDDVTITWTSTGSPGNVNLNFIDVNNWVVNQSIAGNIPNSGSYNWTIPSNIPCDSIRRWQFYVENTARTCWNYGPTFYIKCCKVDTNCNCGKWESDKITATSQDSTATLYCGKVINNSRPVGHIDIQFPNYLCSGTPCESSYEWNISGPIPQSGTTNFISNANFTSPGSYTVTMYAYCGGKLCDSCWFKVNVVDDKDCECKGWKGETAVKVESNGNTKNYSCGKKISTDLNSSLTFTFPDYICSGNCSPRYEWSLIGGSGTIPVNLTGTGQTMNYTFNTPGGYTLKTIIYCGNKPCDSCFVKINVPTKPDTGCKFDVRIDSITCNGRGPNGEPKYKVWSTIDNQTGANAIVHSVRPDNGNILTGGSLLPGLNYLVVDYTLTVIGQTNTCFNFWILNAFNSDTCKYRICKDLPVCSDSGSCGCNGPIRNSFILRKAGQLSILKESPCSSSYTTKPGNFRIEAPTYSCGNGTNCNPIYRWRINGQDVTGYNLPYLEDYYGVGDYNIEVFISCPGSQFVCSMCSFTLRIRNLIPIPFPGDIKKELVGPIIKPSVNNPDGSLRPGFRWDKKAGSNAVFTLYEIKAGSGKSILFDEIKNLLGTEPLIEASPEGNELTYPNEAPDLKKGSYYVWAVYELDEEGNARILNIGFFLAGSDTAAKLLTNCDSAGKDCPGGVYWDIDGKCYCFGK